MALTESNKAQTFWTPPTHLPNKTRSHDDLGSDVRMDDLCHAISGEFVVSRIEAFPQGLPAPAFRNF